MVISFAINRTTVEFNTSGTVWVETTSRQIFVSRGPACASAKEAQSGTMRVRECFGWHLIINAKD